ncbi:MAG: HlyD family efflux transporter periplasmic adaptor subunit [Planctomycetia bacterium]|nr:HlyD family efflux transporter periplasmic adaptor subunit [Planctomycetia bacterium]
MANPNADLGALAVARPAPTATTLRLPRRWWSRVFLPLLLVVGFAVLALWASWDVVSPPVAVKVVPVRVQTGTIEVVGQELFRANGWIEPLPRPVDVPVATEGIYRVKEVLVNPGDRVTAGKPLLLLDDTRAVLTLESAKTRYAKQLAAVKAAKADVKRAEVGVTNAATTVKLAKAESEADVNVATVEQVRAEVGVKAAQLTVSVEEDLWRSKAVVSDVKLRQAQQSLDLAKADRDAADARLAKAKTVAEVRVKQAELALSTARADLASLVAKAEGAEQEADGAAVEVRKAQFELDQTRVVAPIDGVLMALNVRSGTVVGGKDSLPESKGAVATLYDPTKLQVRVEVPVAKFALVKKNQPAEVEVEDVLPGKKIRGVVLYDTHLANVSRNSVPVKVELSGTPPVELRPEMIASVRFLAPPSVGQPKTETARRLIVPRKLLVTDSDQVRVWIVDPVSGRAELRAIELAPGEKERQTETAEVVGGLNPTDKLIATGREQLKPGTRVKVVGEER